MRDDDNVIRTDAKGRPFDKPDKPAKDASVDERSAYDRAMARYWDQVHDCQLKAFSDQFRKALKRDP